MLLAIDSSAGTSAAVLEGSALVSLVVEADPFGHAENIGLVIQRALKQASISAGAITAIALGRGPAPYTGLRVGMAAATAFAAAGKLPLYGVIALHAVAQRLAEDGVVELGAEFAVASDAKRREFFVGRYVADRPLVKGLTAPRVELEAPANAHFLTCDAGMIGQYAQVALQNGESLADTSALYLRNPDVMPSAGKRVTG